MRLEKMTFDYDRKLCALHGYYGDIIALSKEDAFKFVDAIEDSGIHHADWRTSTQQLLIEAEKREDALLKRLTEAEEGNGE